MREMMQPRANTTPQEGSYARHEGTKKTKKASRMPAIVALALQTTL